MAAGLSYRFFFMHPSAPDLDLLTALIDSKQIEVIVDRVFSFPEIKDAMAYLESGRAKGKVVVSFA